MRSLLAGPQVTRRRLCEGRHIRRRHVLPRVHQRDSKRRTRRRGAGRRRRGGSVPVVRGRGVIENQHPTDVEFQPTESARSSERRFRVYKEAPCFRLRPRASGRLYEHLPRSQVVLSSRSQCPCCKGVIASASGGSANGMMSTDLGVREGSKTSKAWSCNMDASAGVPFGF